MTSTTSTRHEPSPAMAALQRFYAAEERYVASGGTDVAAITAAVHPDVVVHSTSALSYGGEWTGRAGFERFLQAFGAAWVGLEVLDPTFLDAGDDTVVVLMTMKATARDTGRTMEMPLCQVNRFRDGLLAEVRPFYWDTAVVNRTLGLG